MRSVWLWGLVAALMVGALSVMPQARADRAVHLVAVGDFGANANTRKVLDGVAAADPDAALALGDLKYQAVPTEADWCSYVQQSIPASLPFELVAGNHDQVGSGDGLINNFAACMPNRVPGLTGTYAREYYLDFPQTSPLVRVIMASPNIRFEDGVWNYKENDSHYQWLSSAIDSGRAAGAKWIVVGLHMPCWTIGVHPCLTSTDVYDLLAAKRVDLVLAGHEHAYMRTNQLVSGGTSCETIPVGRYEASCVADSDNSYQAGAGTVFATVGTGGAPIRAINPNGAEGGYFASSSGSNHSGAYGYLDLQVGETSLGARFVTTSGGPFTDSFTISSGTGTPVNQRPVASFSSTVSGLRTDVDASASSDPDGTVASYAWNWGDGAAVSSGRVANHTYAAAGTYTVTLTVTDNAGATGSTTRQVAVTGGTASPLASDTFTRTTTTGFGSAPVGKAYTVLGSASQYSVDGSTGRIKLVAGSSRRAYLPSVSAPASDTSATFGFVGTPTGKGIYMSVMPRVRPDTSSYRARVIVGPTGTATLGLYRSTSTGVETLMASSKSTLSGVTAASRINVRTQATGTSPTTVRAKMWLQGASEPTAWQVTATDSTAALQGSGGVGVFAYESSSSTSAMTVIVDNLTSKAP